jgi:hypothetical protein
MSSFTESTIEQVAIDWLNDVCTMTKMLVGWTMIELGCNHRVHLMRKIIVPDDEEYLTLARLRDTLSLPRVMRGEVRVER